MASSTILETGRLLLREVELTDLDGFYRLDSDPEVHRYLGNRPVTDRRQLEEVIGFIRRQYAEFGTARLSVVEKSTGQFIGWCGLKFVTETINQHTHYYDLGYRLIRNYWGRGYASEAAAASLQYVFTNLKIPKIYAAAHIENLASNRILTKLGFNFKNTFTYDGAVHNWYEI